ncbi:MAG: phosphatidylglycerophosphatase A [Gammaproteobacteria bacterium]
MNPVIHPRQLKNPLVLLALGFGSGLAPKAPGTAGTLVAIPLYWSMRTLDSQLYALIVAVLFVIGVGLCAYAAKRLGVHDHPGIVFDEIVGFLIALFAVPFDWGMVVAGFILFRLFDALKPWPISWFDKNLHGGFGIMFDDVLAGIAAAAVLHAWLFWFAG